MTGDPRQVAVAVAEAHREHWAMVVAATMRRVGDLDLAEDCAQEAFTRALTAWPRELPANPAGWLRVVATRVAIDRLRQRARQRRLQPLVVAAAADRVAADAADATSTAPPGGGTSAGEGGRGEVEQEADEADPLRLLFLCCHPALSRDAQVALTLRLMCGLTTAEIGAVLLVQESTVAARITRAKRKIAAAAIPFRLPTTAEMSERLGSALTVVHLTYTAGHTAIGAGDDRLDRDDLARRAVAIARRLVHAFPAEAEAQGLLALLLFNEARRPTRVDHLGQLVLLGQQDRRRWDQQLVREGLALATSALDGGGLRFAYEAAIAGLHASAPTFDTTDWVAVVAMYDRLYACWPSPIVALNRAAARSFVPGTDLDAVLAELDALAEADELRGYPYLAATCADVLARLERPAAAAAAYEEALGQCRNDVERRFIAGRRAALTP